MCVEKSTPHAGCFVENNKGLTVYSMNTSNRIFGSIGCGDLIAWTVLASRNKMVFRPISLGFCMNRIEDPTCYDSGSCVANHVMTHLEGIPA